MASKNTIALFLTINLVFFGFTVAQFTPTCTRNLEACANALGTIPFNLANIARPCCDSVAGLDATYAALCLCDALKGTEIPVGVIGILLICGFTPPPRVPCSA